MESKREVSEVWRGRVLVERREEMQRNGYHTFTSPHFFLF